MTGICKAPETGMRIKFLATYITRVVDEPCGIAFHSGIHYKMVINAEHVTPNVLKSKTKLGWINYFFSTGWLRK